MKTEENTESKSPKFNLTMGPVKLWNRTMILMFSFKKFLGIRYSRLFRQNKPYNTARGHNMEHQNIVFTNTTITKPLR